MSEIGNIDRFYLLPLVIVSLGICLVWALWELEQIRERWRSRRVAAVALRWILLVGLF